MSATTDRTVLFGWPRDQGSVLHAVIDAYDPPENSTFTLVLNGEPVEAHDGDPQFTLRRSGALCGVRGGFMQFMRVTPGVVFSPDGYADRPHATVCAKCTRIWATKYAPAIDGWTKRCASCHKDVPVSRFRSDRRRKDGMAGVCEPCQDAARRAHQQADQVLREAARDFEYLTRRRRWADELAARLMAWQGAPWAATFTCADAQHVLRAERTEREEAYERVAQIGLRPGEADRTERRMRTVIDVQWVCECGTASVPDRVRRLVNGVHQIDKGALWSIDLGPTDMR